MLNYTFTIFCLSLRLCKQYTKTIIFSFILTIVVKLRSKETRPLKIEL